METIILTILFLVIMILMFLGLGYAINRIILINSAKKREKLLREHTNAIQKDKEIKVEAQTPLEEIKDDSFCEIKESNDKSVITEEGIETVEEKAEKLAESIVVRNANRKNKQDNKRRNIMKKNATKQLKKAAQREPEYPGHRIGRAKKKKYALEMLKYYGINYTYAGESEKVVFVENRFKLNLETLEFMNLTTKYKEKGIKRMLYRLRVPGIERSRGVCKNGK